MDLKAKPFYLSDQDIAWVENVRDSLSLEEKIGQLFCYMGNADDGDEPRDIIEDFKPGGVLYRPNKAAKIQEVQRYLQSHSRVPLLLAANLEEGGSGIAVEATHFACQLQVAATDDEENAYRLGLVAGREGRAVGCNWAFAPVVDIDLNYRNPITNTRTYGSDAERVLRFGQAYMKGMQESGLAVSIKHFPGDGVDDRDHHLHPTTNHLSCQAWQESFGKVYQGLIDAGALTVMVGHFIMPQFLQQANPHLTYEEMLPASLSPVILRGLLRETLGFNGLVVTDATLMAGFSQGMKREEAVPLAIASGCDMFLFNQNFREDAQYMQHGLEKGILSQERLDEAVTRILALKAALKLHLKQAEGTLVPSAPALTVLNCEEHRAWAKECAHKAVTLVKDRQSLLPLSCKTHKKVVLYGMGRDKEISGGLTMTRCFADKLEARGFQVSVFDLSQADLSLLKRPLAQQQAETDLVIYLANLENASDQTTVRLSWSPPMGINIPRYIHEVPTLFISLANPYHLQDVPRLKTFINAYTATEPVLEAVVEKILGESAFLGQSPIDPFCGYWDAKL